MKIKQWTEKTKEREQWRLVVEEAKAKARAVAPRGWRMFILNPTDLLFIFV
jgi:hypothetical protein